MIKSQKQATPKAQQSPAREQLLRITHELDALRNQSDLVEIMCNFWPLPNMVERSQRISKQIEQLNQTQHVLAESLEQKEAAQNTTQPQQAIEALPEAERFDAPQVSSPKPANRKPSTGLVNRFVQLSKASA